MSLFNVEKYNFTLKKSWNFIVSEQWETFNNKLPIWTCIIIVVYD